MIQNLYTKTRFPVNNEEPKDIGHMIIDSVANHHYSKNGHLVDRATNKVNILMTIVADVARLLMPFQQDELARLNDWFKVEPDEEFDIEDMLS